MSKGSQWRKRQFNKKAYDENWDRIFGDKRKEESSRPNGDGSVPVQSGGVRQGEGQQGD